MILIGINDAEVTLQAYALEADGAEKLDITAAYVRVYYVDIGSEVEVLASTAMAQVGATNLWRYNWVPATLPVREYVAEYTLTDSFGVVSKFGEDIVVRDLADLAKQPTLLLVQADLELVKKVETGRWKIEANQMTFYDDDGVTPLLVFDLFDQSGLPSMENVFERREP